MLSRHRQPTGFPSEWVVRRFSFEAEMIHHQISCVRQETMWWSHGNVSAGSFLKLCWASWFTELWTESTVLNNTMGSCEGRLHKGTNTNTMWQCARWNLCEIIIHVKWKHFALLCMGSILKAYCSVFWVGWSANVCVCMSKWWWVVVKKMFAPLSRPPARAPSSSPRCHAQALSLWHKVGWQHKSHVFKLHALKGSRNFSELLLRNIV